MSRILIVISIFLLNAAGMYAQAVASAEIHGTITDSSGAGVPGAQVRATQTEMGQVTTTVAGTDGAYVLTNLPVGPYRFEAAAPAFSTYVQSGITLQVGNNVQVNVVLQVGKVTDTITVSAAAAMVETQDTSVSQVIDQRRIIDLPLNGRQVTDLILLSGGANVPPNAASRVVTTHDYSTAVGISISGGQINGNNYLSGWRRQQRFALERESAVPVSRRPAGIQRADQRCFGALRTASWRGGQCRHQIRHQSDPRRFFEFVRNGNFNARNFFAPTQDTLRRNQFGGTVGGPVKKDRIFVFLRLSGHANQNRAAADRIRSRPTQAALSGDFSTIESAACQSSRKAVHAGGSDEEDAPFPNNLISRIRFSTPAAALAEESSRSRPNPCGR